MALYFETSIRYDKIHDNGVVKKTTEKYLVDALSFTEAEAKIIEAQKAFISGEFEVSAVKKTKIAEIVKGKDTGIYYLAKVGFITLDEKTAVEKRNITLLLLDAECFDEALALLNTHMKDTMADWEIVSLSETEILGIY